MLGWKKIFSCICLSQLSSPIKASVQFCLIKISFFLFLFHTLNICENPLSRMMVKPFKTQQPKAPHKFVIWTSAIVTPLHIPANISVKSPPKSQLKIPQIALIWKQQHEEVNQTIKTHKQAAKKWEIQNIVDVYWRIVCKSWRWHIRKKSS